MICRLKAGASRSLNTFWLFCKIASVNELGKMFQPLRSIAGCTYRISCTKVYMFI